MMTHEEIQATIKRLRDMRELEYYFNCFDVAQTFLGRKSMTNVVLRDALIDLLAQADPYARMPLPKDMNDETIHVGDMLYHKYQGCLGGPFEVKELVLRTGGWSIEGKVSPAECLIHHDEFTVNDVVNELRDMRDKDPEAVVTRCSQLADILRKLS